MVRSTFRAAAMLAVGSALVACGGAQSADEGELPAVCDAYLGDEPEAPFQRAVPLPVSQDAPVVITGATVMTAVGDVFEPGYVVFADGAITAVGAGDPEALPDGAVVYDRPGAFVTPGIIDTHSHLGVYPTPYVPAHSDGNEATGPMTPQVEAVHSVWPQDPGFQRAVEGGITALQILPGSANLIGGRGFIMKPHDGALNAEELRIEGAPETLKMACGENPKRVYGGRGQMPSTRMGSTATMRQAWIDAQDYVDAEDDYRDAMQDWCEDGAPEDDEPDAPSRNLANETLAGVLRGEIMPHIHCYRADEMLTQMQLADEFGYSIRSFHHAVESYKIRWELAEHDISISTWADWWGFKIEAYDAIVENAALLHEAGVRAVIHSDSAIGIQRLNQEAAKAYHAGLRGGIELDDDDALSWITINAAWALGIDEMTGSLEVGKMADVVVWDAHPFSVYASPELVFIDGVLEHDANDPSAPWSDFEDGQWPLLEEWR